MIGTAWAAGAAHSESIFSDPAFWVAVAFFLFFALAGKALWGRISAMLDKRAAMWREALFACVVTESCASYAGDAKAALDAMLDAVRLEHCDEDAAFAGALTGAP